jgi:hypothetical protein
VVVVAMTVLGNPGAGARVLALVLSIYFIVGGLFRIIASVPTKLSSWGWRYLMASSRLCWEYWYWRTGPPPRCWYSECFPVSGSSPADGHAWCSRWLRRGFRSSLPDL